MKKYAFSFNLFRPDCHCSSQYLCLIDLRNPRHSKKEKATCVFSEAFLYIFVGH